MYTDDFEFVWSSSISRRRRAAIAVRFRVTLASLGGSFLRQVVRLLTVRHHKALLLLFEASVEGVTVGSRDPTLRSGQVHTRGEEESYGAPEVL